MGDFLATNGVEEMNIHDTSCGRVPDPSWILVTVNVLDCWILVRSTDGIYENERLAYSISLLQPAPSTAGLSCLA